MKTPNKKMKTIAMVAWAGLMLTGGQAASAGNAEAQPLDSRLCASLLAP